MSSRLGFRFLNSLRQTPTRKPISSFTQQSTQTRRFADLAASTEQSGFSKFWNSNVGPKTVHFWAPVMKWGVVLAGAADFLRPASALSISQNAALVCTGAIWTRWCFVIRPKNMFLASVNFMLFLVGATQVSRVLLYQRSLKDGGLGDEVKRLAKDEAGDLKSAVKEAELKVKSSV